MTRRTYVMHNGELIEKHLVVQEQENKSAFVMGDLKPHQSMVTGEVVSSRSRHREILRQHNLIEVGNETSYLKSKPITTPTGLKETIIRNVRKYQGY